MKRVNQKNLTAGGHIAGGDVIINGAPESALRRRSKELQVLYSTDADYKGFIEKLQKFIAPPMNGSQPRDLETKLKSGGRHDQIERAKLCKEEFSKKLSKHQFSEQAQELFAHILAQINTFFNQKVRGKIANGVDSSEIDSLIYDELIKPIYDDVGDGKLGVTTDDIEGMIYYLTGNCHLEWS